MPVRRRVRRRLLRGQQVSPEAAPLRPGAGGGVVADGAAHLDATTVRGAVYVNAFRPLEPSFASTALRTHPLRYDALRQAQTRIAEEFLVNSRLRRGDTEFEASVAAYFTEPGVGVPPLVGRDGRRGIARVDLPGSIPLRLGFDATVERRRSIRAYTGDPLTLAYLATILRTACGITGRGGRAGELALRATPSGGGLYPVDVHVAALRVDSLSRATYVYDPLQDVLWQTGDGPTVDSLLASVAAPDEVVMTGSAAALVFLLARPWRVMRKYGPRGMRHVFLEAGAIAEHVNLAAAALGVGSVDSSSFYDDEVHEALGVDGVFEALVHAQVLGIPG
jgi:SagB-type dehydrogenase family enzyme